MSDAHQPADPSAADAVPSDAALRDPVAEDLAEDLDEDAHLEGLDTRFIRALRLRTKGDVDGCAEELRAILKAEPRLAEPHLELASLLLEQGRPEEALAHGEEAARLLDSGSPWLAEPPHAVLQGMAWDAVGEALRRQADSDEVVFGPPDRFMRLMSRARAAFARAAQLDPDNEHAAHWSLHLDTNHGGEE